MSKFLISTLYSNSIAKSVAIKVNGHDFFIRVNEQITGGNFFTQGECCLNQKSKTPVKTRVSLGKSRSWSMPGEGADDIRDQKIQLVSLVVSVIGVDGGHQSNGLERTNGQNTDNNDDCASSKAHSFVDANDDQIGWLLLISPDQELGLVIEFPNASMTCEANEPAETEKAWVLDLEADKSDWCVNLAISVVSSPPVVDLAL
ncbi:hypothetical protein Ancab_004528 [Ancistrocladus abbreviatus]